MSRDSATRPKRRPARRLGATALAVLGLVGLGTGSASQVSLAGTAVAAGSAMIAPCQGSAPISATFTTAYANNRYEASAVQLTGIDAACNGRPYTFRVVTTTGYLNPEEDGTVANGAATESITTTPVANILRVEVVIS